MTPVDRLNAALEGRYRIERELGTGGMATVYLAEDVKHHRKVAIKVLREDLSATVGSARFLREIEIVAQLQHPNILPLLDSGEADGLLFFVMPYVEGKSLRERLHREHELPVHEAVRILIEIVDALSTAHAHGVVHRDMKPDNVMLSGRHALVADFGVARAVSEAAEATESEDAAITTLGVALGTPAYMSPEQASADPDVDHRADIYAVGVVAYEMLGGTLPFSARSPQQMLAAHVTETPVSLEQHRPGLNPLLVAAVMRCLAKRPADRWQRADDLLAVLEPLATPSGGMDPTLARMVPTPARSRKPLVWMALGAAVVIGAGSVIASRLAGSSQPSLTVGRSRQVTSEPGLQLFPAISPDGKLVAFASGNARRMRIFVRPVDGGRTITVSDDSSAVESQPRWSPDGSQLLFLTHGGASVAPALGGVVRALIPQSASASSALGPDVESAAWSPDGREIAFVRGDSLQAVSVTGGDARFIAKGTDLYGCRWSPDGRWIGCVSGNGESLRLVGSFGNMAPSTILVAPATGGAFQALTSSTSLNQSPEWSPDGTLLYFISNRDGPRDVYETRIGSDGRPRGDVQRLTTGLNAMSVSVSGDTKRLAYSIYSSRANVWTLPISTGTPVVTESATQLTTGNQTIESIRVSRDGKWMLYDSDLNGPANIYRVPLAGGQPEQLTHEEFDVFAPDLSGDGRVLAYHSWRTGTRDIEVKPLDGGPVEFVTNSPLQESYPTLSPDGSRIAFYDQSPARQLYVVSRAGPGRWSAPIKRSRGQRAEWSPDGRLLAFASVDRRSIMIQPAESGAERTVYTVDKGAPEPSYVVWAVDGRSLIFKAHDREGRASFWSVPVTGGTPRLLARLSDLARPSHRPDFFADASRLYFTIEDKQSNIWVADVASR